MLSDAIDLMREQFRCLDEPAKRTVRECFPGFDTTLHLWSITARDYEVSQAAMIAALQPEEGEEGVPRPPAKGPRQRLAQNMALGPAKLGPPQIARRYGLGGVR